MSTIRRQPGLDPRLRSDVPCSPAVPGRSTCRHRALGPIGSQSCPGAGGPMGALGVSKHQPMQGEVIPCFPPDGGDGKVRRAGQAAGTGRGPKLQGPARTSVTRHQPPLSHQCLIYLIAPLLLPHDIVPSGATLKRSLPLFTPAAINVPGETEGPGWAAGPPCHTRPAVKFPIRLQIHETPSALWLPRRPGGRDQLPWGSPGSRLRSCSRQGRRDKSLQHLQPATQNLPG